MTAGKPARRVPAGSAKNGRLAPLLFPGLFAILMVASHAGLLGLPYYWDELGQFIPAALDIYQHGDWVPKTTVPNVHPPGLMAFLALVWRVFGYGIPVTRLAMLLVATACVFVTFLLAIRLCRGLKGAPALFAVLLLLVSPLFYIQAMLAQLDLPAALFTVWALLWFLDGRYRDAALVSVGLVFMKETGIVVPLVMGAWLWFEGKRRDAYWFALPLIPLAGWLGVLTVATGNPLGNREFGNYNLTFPLHPLRLTFALLRRVSYLFLENFHWIGWLAILQAWRRGFFRDRAWRIAALVALAQVLFVTILGGATLERYLLPALPILYIAMAAAFAVVWQGWGRFGQAALVAGLLAGLFWNPPYPFPYENNLAVVDFVRLQQAAARFVEKTYAGRRVTTAWPLTSALRRPEFGYVGERVPVREIASFTPTDLTPVSAASVDVFVLYSRDWEGRLDFRRIPRLSGLVRRLYGFEPQVTPEALERRLGVILVGSFRERGQWVAIFEKRTGR